MIGWYWMALDAVYLRTGYGFAGAPASRELTRQLRKRLPGSYAYWCLFDEAEALGFGKTVSEKL